MGNRQGSVEGLGMSRTVNPGFWRGRRVFLTGHTGFKGSWLSLILSRLGAQVSGYALPPVTDPALWHLIQPVTGLASVLGDINHPAPLAAAMAAAEPEIILHLAAQPLVRPSYAKPVATFATNVMGTVNVLEAARHARHLKAILVVTTDKVYRNDGQGHPFGENNPLGGHDPYSASKAACEIAVESWRKSFFQPRGIALATARAGNVIGGGDFAADRVIPDIFRSFQRGEPVILRYPGSTRPWQHVLDCLNGYLLYAERLCAGGEVPFAFNFGPDGAPVAVAELVETMQAALGAGQGWTTQPDANNLKEAALLALDTTAARAALDWRDQLDTSQAIAQTARWYAAFARGADMRAGTLAEIAQHYPVKSG